MNSINMRLVKENGKTNFEYLIETELLKTKNKGESERKEQECPSLKVCFRAFCQDQGMVDFKDDA